MVWPQKKGGVGFGGVGGGGRGLGCGLGAVWVSFYQVTVRFRADVLGDNPAKVVFWEVCCRDLIENEYWNLIYILGREI